MNMRGMLRYQALVIRAGAVLLSLTATATLLAQVPDAARILVDPPAHFIDKNADNSHPTGLGPAQMRAAYGFDQLTNQGQGQTIGIIIALDAPTIESDLAVFDTQFQLPACNTNNGCFQKIYADGTPPPGDLDWALDAALDVEQAHSLAPAAKIILVEAGVNTLADLLHAVDVAIANGANQVSMSWTSLDFSGEQSYDYHFNVAAVTFLGSAGDNGHGVGYPSASPYVISVGGTSLKLTSLVPLPNSQQWHYGYESAWSRGGGGISAFEPEPSFQQGVQSTGFRSVPDVSSDSDPLSGVPVYDAYGGYQWTEQGGTSLAAPDWSAVFAIANSLRVKAGKSPISQALPDLYNFLATSGYADFHDITSGSNGSCGSVCEAGPGYDSVTGIGSPIVNKLVPALVKAAK
jgi:subtilase family serine protease